MLILIVDIWVKPDQVEDFIRATADNVRNSLREEGVRRFDFVRDNEDPGHFVLYEAYRGDADHARHRETPHYLKWKEAVGGMMASERSSRKYRPALPGEA